ncbi:dUTP diphosphatase [Lactococcus lactis]|uniref:dUTP diphosphatase n=1 Tax=Lactococcus lactis TaxID=1358 RepID=UPI002416D082|nr:dUTP diphosphatase [Lactococcus lactis]MDG4974281.1 dUTP diphosphatase [Lactococcus lactis]
MARQFVKRGDSKATIPERATKGSAGYDIAASEEVIIQPGEIKLVHTGLAVQMEQDDVMLLIDRSSNPRKRGIVLSNSLGVIDHDYFPNEFMGMFTNITDKPVTIEAGQRIMQAVFVKYGLVDNDDANGERTGGFGSTGEV